MDSIVKGGKVQFTKKKNDTSFISYSHNHRKKGAP